jgi:hypothetical protein
MAANKLKLALLAAVLAVASRAHAANNCPWLNEATAGGLLGGPAVNTFTDAANGMPAMCHFEEKGSDGLRTLTITVEVKPDAHAKLTAMMHECGATNQLLQAIGNEAAVCAMDTKRKQLSERVVGRVRDQVFTIVIASTLKEDNVLNKDTLMTKIYTASEQVAGSLF